MKHKLYPIELTKLKETITTAEANAFTDEELGMLRYQVLLGLQSYRRIEEYHICAARLLNLNILTLESLCEENLLNKSTSPRFSPEHLSQLSNIIGWDTLVHWHDILAHNNFTTACNLANSWSKLVNKFEPFQLFLEDHKHRIISYKDRLLLYGETKYLEDINGTSYRQRRIRCDRDPAALCLLKTLLSVESPPCFNSAETILQRFLKDNQDYNEENMDLELLFYILQLLPSYIDDTIEIMNNKKRVSLLNNLVKSSMDAARRNLFVKLASKDIPSTECYNNRAARETISDTRSLLLVACKLLSKDELENILATLSNAGGIESNSEVCFNITRG